MSNYIKTVDFAVKDTYTTGDSRKVVKGAEINNEFVNVATAIATKEDTSNKNIANGYAALDSGALVPVASLPSSLLYNTTPSQTISSSTNGTTALIVSNPSSGTSANSQLNVQAGSGVNFFGITGASYSGPIWTGGATSPVAFLGTSTSIPLSIATADIERLRIDGSGNATFNQTLTVTGATILNGSATFNGTTQAASLTVGGVSVTSASIITSGTLGMARLPASVYRAASLGSGVITIQSGGSPPSGSDGDICFIY